MSQIVSSSPLNYVLLFLLLPLLVACMSDEEQAIDVDSGGDFFVESIDIQIMESFPVQASALVRGSLADGCVVLDGVSAERRDDTFVLTVATHREGDVCTAALVPFEAWVDLNVDGAAAGTYQVVVGDISAEFTLDMDN